MKGPGQAAGIAVFLSEEGKAMTSMPPYVSAADQDNVDVSNYGAVAAQLGALGFKSWDSGRVMRKAAPERADMARIFMRLRDLGVAFSSDYKGWPPEAIVELLHEDGLLNGQFTIIYWTGPGAWHLRTIDLKIKGPAS
jgi:hypothetical protein